MDIRRYNRDAWNKAVERNDPWTIPVTPDVIARARAGDWSIRLTPTRAVPADWLPPVANLDVLCLASGGGQQGPVLAAAGARVTVFDLSPAQLAQDRAVATRDSLTLTTIAGDMADLSAFVAASFDLIINPVSTCFVPDVLPVWRECRRVLRPGGRLLAGFVNPLTYTFDQDLMRREQRLTLRHALPYSDITSLSDEERARYTSYDATLEFSHTMSTLLGGQLAAGLHLTGFYEDDWGGTDVVDRFVPSFFATSAT